MNATQQVKERRGARAHAHEARAERNIEFHAAAGKNVQGRCISKLRLPLESEFSISQGIL